MVHKYCGQVSDSSGPLVHISIRSDYAFVFTVMPFSPAYIATVANSTGPAFWTCTGRVYFRQSRDVPRIFVWTVRMVCRNWFHCNILPQNKHNQATGTVSLNVMQTQRCLCLIRVNWWASPSLSHYVVLGRNRAQIFLTCYDRPTKPLLTFPFQYCIKYTSHCIGVRFF